MCLRANQHPQTNSKQLNRLLITNSLCAGGCFPALQIVCLGRNQCLQTYRADWLAWLGVLTMVGSGEGLLCGGGGLSGSSVSSRGSSLMCTGGSTGPGPAHVTEAGSGMEMEEGGAEEGGG